MDLGWGRRTTHTLKFILRKRKVALLVDDFGYSDGPILEAFFEEIDIPLTIAIVPGSPYASLVAKAAYKHNKEVVVHLPMQPKGSFAGTYRWIVLEGMSETKIKELVRDAVKDVPHARGLSNHMGSLITTREKPMRAVLEAVQSENLYFVDSRTATASVAFSLAKKMGVKSARNATFLDNNKEIDYIEERFHYHLESQKSEEDSVAICHVNPVTAQAIKRIVSRLERKKVEMVFVSEIVK